MKKEWIGKHYLSRETISIRVKDGTVQEMRKADVDTDIWISPGLIDVQVNGFAGLDLNGFETTTETVQQITSKLYQYGVTRFCPTIVTGPADRMHHCLKVIAEAYEKDFLTNYSMIGIHVEGPFLSAEDGPRGAHKRNWIRNPDWNEFLEWQKISDQRIKKVTLAPEKPGAIEFIEKLSKTGIIPALGHTNATETDIQKAVAAGAKMSTHLGNGSHPYIKRHPNYIWSQLASDELWASFIADGFHLPPSTLKAMIRSKGNKAILTSDAVHLAGMSPGRYKTNLNEDVTLEADGFLHLTETPDILAGSATPLIRGVQNIVDYKIAQLSEALDMASSRPAKLFELSDDGVGQLSVGSPADFILFTFKDGEIKLIETVANGTTVFRARN